MRIFEGFSLRWHEIRSSSSARGVSIFLASLFGLGILNGSCAKESMRSLTACRSYVVPGPIYDMADPGPEAGYIVLSVQERSRVDAAGELLNDGGIYFLNRKTLDAVRPAVQGRDDYPFKPRGIDVVRDKNEVLVFVVNEAFREQRSLESYRVVKNGLVFVRRWRFYRMKALVDVSAFGPEELLLASMDSRSPFAIGGGGDIMVFRNRLFRSLPVSLGSPQRFGSNGGGVVLVPSPEKKMVLEVSSAGLVRPLLEFDVAPVSVQRRDGTLFVLQRDEGDGGREKLTILRESGQTVERVQYFSPIRQPEAMLVLAGEKKIVVSGKDASNGRLAVCDLP